MMQPETMRPRPEAGAENARDRELKAILADLYEHTETLVRQELELGKVELDHRLQSGKAALIRGSIAGGLFHAAYLTALATLVLVLAVWLPPWLASLIVAIVAATGAFTFSRLGKRSLEKTTEPPQAAQHYLERQRAHS